MLASPWKMRLVAVSAATVVLFSTERAARATDCTGTLTSTCINSDTLWPHAGAARFLGIGGAETIAAGQFGFGLVTSYLSRPIVIHTFSPGPTGGGSAGSDQYAVNDQVNATFLWGFGVTDRLELGLALPITLGQGGTGIGPITGGTGLQDTAMRDLRIGVAYAIVPRARVGNEVAGFEPGTPPRKPSLFAMTARLELSAPTGDRDQFAGERSTVLVPSVAADFRMSRFFGGVELGARIRPTTELLGARIGSQGSAGVGVGYDLLARELLAIALEARALPTFTEQHDASIGAAGIQSTPNGKLIMPAEWTASLRTAPLAGGDLAIQLGGGGAIPLAKDPAPTTPRFRFTLGIRFAPLARDTDGDGVLDKDDKCPFVRAPALPGLPADGCPHDAALPRADVPRLNLGLVKDACTTEPESVDGFRDDDGCPDEDADKDGIPNRFDRCPQTPEDFAGLSDGCPELTGATPENKKP